MKSGIIYQTDRGEYGLAIFEEQHEGLQAMDKVLIHVYLDVECRKPKLTPDGKRYRTLKDIHRLTIIGYQD